MNKTDFQLNREVAQVFKIRDPYSPLPFCTDYNAVRLLEDKLFEAKLWPYYSLELIRRYENIVRPDARQLTEAALYVMQREIEEKLK